MQQHPAERERGGAEKTSEYPWRELLAPANVPTWCLVGVGIVAGFLAQRTLRAIKKQSDLQMIALRQWLEIEFIKSFPTTPIYRKDSRIVETLSLELRFQVVNKTPLPLAVKRIITTVSKPSEESPGPEWETYELNESQTLPPKGETGGSVYPFFVPAQAFGDSVRAYQANALIYHVTIKVFFESAAGRKEEHTSDLMLCCGLHANQVIENIGRRPVQLSVEDKQEQ